MAIITTREALAAGLTHRDLSSQRFRRVFHGVYVTERGALTPELIVGCARRILPAEATITGAPILHLCGVPVGRVLPVPVITSHHVRRAGFRTIPRRPEHPVGALAPPLLALEHLGLGRSWLLAGADGLLAAGRICREDLSRLDSLRWLAALVDDAAGSIPESRVRYVCLAAGLPRPVCQLVVRDDHGGFVARVDLAWPTFRVVVEYEGLQHATDTGQWGKDIERYETLQRLGWTVVRLTSADLRAPERLVLRVDEALRRAGHRGRRPRLDGGWLSEVA